MHRIAASTLAVALLLCVSATAFAASPEGRPAGEDMLVYEGVGSTVAYQGGGTGVAIGVAVQPLHADTLEPVGFDGQFDGTELVYLVTVFQPLPTGVPIEGGGLTLTLPDGTQETLDDDLPFIDFASPATYLSGVYVTDSTDAVGSGSLVAWADVGETLRVVQPCPTAPTAPVDGCQLAVTASIPTNTLAGLCVGDLDQDGVVGVPDLVLLVGAWGTVAPWADIEPSLSGGYTGVPDVLDLCGIMYRWGECE